ncbi:MAG: hypothetical protein Q9184_005443 [Pyrenodesmia sp. 2 TL-2023]
MSQRYINLIALGLASYTADVASRREYHIVVLGAGGVGKSCLTGPFSCKDSPKPLLTAAAAQFVQNVWIESYDPTIEDSYRKQIEVDVRVSLDTVIRLDTAGTEQFTAMRELYMKSGQGFLLVFSITSLSSLTELHELRDQIVRIKDDAQVPLVIVGNKCDLEEDRVVSRARAFAVSQSWGNVHYYETSARRRANVDEAFVDLCRQIIRKDAATSTIRDMERGSRKQRDRPDEGAKPAQASPNTRYRNWNPTDVAYLCLKQQASISANLKPSYNAPPRMKPTIRTPFALRKLIRPIPRRPPLLLHHRRPIATHTYSHHAKQLSILPTNIDTSSPTYIQNAAQYANLMSQMQDLHRKIEKGGTEKAREKNVGRGKMLVRDRITALIDTGTPFLELSTLAGHEVYPGEDVPAGGIITGVGTVMGVQLSALSIPQISLILGPCTAGGAYIPAMSDESIIVRNQGTIFLAGPPLVKAATGEVVTAEELGGGKVHSEVSGVVDYSAVDDAHAIVLGRRCVANLGLGMTGKGQKREEGDVKEPLYNAEELGGIAGTDLRKQVDVREIIARIVDGSEFAEFKKDYGETLVTGFAHIHGHRIGILANNGILFSTSALKGAHFIQLCTQRKTPLLFLQNISGFMVGAEAEHGGIAKNGAKLVTAVACAEVPKFTVVTGGSFGAGNYGMCGRAYSPRFLLSWPNARVGVMGSEQLSAVMETVGKTVDPELKKRIERESHVVFGSARLWDDGVIPPSHTRDVLGQALRAAKVGEERETRFGVFRM